MYVKEVDTGKVTQLAKPGTTSGSMAWALDNSTLFYLTLVRSCASELPTLLAVCCTGMFSKSSPRALQDVKEHQRL